MKKQSISLIVRADVRGSVEVIKHVILDEIIGDGSDVKIHEAGIGNVTEGDLDLAVTTGALVIAFKVPVGPDTLAAANRRGVQINSYDVLYEMLDHLRSLLDDMD